MTIARSPSGPLLPPNCRVRRPKTPPVIQAPEEQAAFGPETAEETSSPAVSVAAAQARSARLREGLRALAGGLVTASLAIACAYGLVRYTRTSPRFGVRNIEVQGTAHLGAADLARIGGVEVGANIFSIDVESVRQRILQDPWIEKAAITRRLPGTVRFDVVERDPAALVAVGSQLYLSTRQGELFKRLDTGDPPDLPIVTGLLPENVSRDRAGAAVTIQRALDLATEYERSGPAKTLPVQEIHAEEDGAFSLVVGRDPIVLRLGRGPFRQPVEQAARVLSEVAARRAQASVVFLDNEAHPERVVVRMR